jgi:hypothetical protein
LRIWLLRAGMRTFKIAEVGGSVVPVFSSSGITIIILQMKKRVKITRQERKKKVQRPTLGIRYPNGFLALVSHLSNGAKYNSGVATAGPVGSPRPSHTCCIETTISSQGVTCA